MVSNVEPRFSGPSAGSLSCSLRAASKLAALKQSMLLFLSFSEASTPQNQTFAQVHQLPLHWTRENLLSGTSNRDSRGVPAEVCLVPREERASVRLSSPSKTGRGQQAGEYLKLYVRCPWPSVSPSRQHGLSGDRGLHRRMGDVRYWRFESFWHARSKDVASRYKPVVSR